MTALNKWECTFERTRYHFSKPCGGFWDQIFDENARLRFDARCGLFLFKFDCLTHGVAFRDLIAQTPKKSRGTAAILKIRRHKIKRATKCSNIAFNSSKLYKRWACRFDAKTSIDHFLKYRARRQIHFPISSSCHGIARSQRPGSSGRETAPKELCGGSSIT